MSRRRFDPLADTRRPHWLTVSDLHRNLITYTGVPAGSDLRTVLSAALALLVLATLMAGCQPKGPSQKELFDLRSQCIAMAIGGDAAHYDVTRNRCFTTHVEDYVGQGKIFNFTLNDAQSHELLMVCSFYLESPAEDVCEGNGKDGKTLKVGRGEAEAFFKSRMGEDAVPFPTTKP